jgi:hypothetical protein
MRRLEAVSWVLSLCYGLRLSQAKALADLTASAMRAARASLANLGRGLLGPAACKHRIKRAWRFCANDRVHVSDAMRGLIQKLCERRRNKPLVVALDWTDVRSFHLLMLSAVQEGRALPLLWESCPQWRLSKSQNALEEGMLLLLREMVPASVPVVLLADRGFGRAEMARLCQALKIHYVIRVKPDVYVEHPGYKGLLCDYPVKKGMRRALRDVRYRRDDPVTHHLVVRWKAGLPKKRDEPWFLMTDVGDTAARLTEGYGKRMTIEEYFRDGKNKRDGWSLRDTQITKAERLDRPLLALAMAYWPLVGVGLLARRWLPPGAWCSSNDPGQCSTFTIGRVMVERLRAAASAAFAALLQATIEILYHFYKLGMT